MTLTPVEILVVIALLIACYTDLTTQKIPNGITFPLIVAGIVYNLVVGPWWFGLLGFAVAVPIHLGLWTIGLDKGGDAKLMMGIGATLGWAFVLEATAWSFVALLPVAIVEIALRGKWNNLWQTFKFLFTWPFLKLLRLPVAEPPEPTWAAKAPVITAAVVLAWLTTLLDVTPPAP